MHWGLIRSIIVLPGTGLVIIPALLLWVAAHSKFSHQISSPSQILFWLALLAASLGLGLAGRTVTLFMKFGEGTPAPWDPPKKLVILGPYRYFRNPMITGALLVLLAEAMLLRSWPIVIWMMVFFIGNAIYFPFIEEKGLERRFGNDYLVYKTHVPRWIPRLQAWKQENDDKPKSS